MTDARISHINSGLLLGSICTAIVASLIGGYALRLRSQQPDSG